MPLATQFTDGDYSARALVAPTKIVRPFLNWPSKDAVTKLFDRLYEIDRASYAPFAEFATLPADGADDPADANAYLLEEGEPDLAEDGTQRTRCLFGHVPPTQTKPDNVGYSRPVVPGSGQGRNYGTEADGNSGFFYQPDTALDRFKAHSRRAIATDQGVANAPTGGTYTLAFGANTTAGQAYNVVAATLKAALDGLASVTAYGGLATLAGVYTDADGFLATFNNFAAGTVDASGVLAYPDSELQANVTTSNGGWTQQVAIQLVNSIIAAGTGDGSLLTGSSLTPTLPMSSGGRSITCSSLFAVGTATPSIGTGSLTGGAGLAGGSNEATGAELRVTFAATAATVGITGGTYTLTLYGQTTAPIAYNADVVTIKAALDLACTNATARGAIRVAAPYAGGPLNTGFNGNPALYFSVFITPTITGGSYTLTLFGDTTGAIAYNASTATIQTALNALAGVMARGNCTVSGAGYALQIDGSYTLSFLISFPDAAFTGGTYTLTLFGQTTAGIAHNSSLAAIQSALNALSEITDRGGAVVTGAGLSGQSISFTLTFSAAAFVGVSSLTGTPSAVNVALVSGTNGRQQTIKLTASQVARLLTFTNPHGALAGEPMYFKMGSTYFLDRADWTYISPTQISVDPAVAPWSTNTGITEGGKFQGDYAPGPADHRARAVHAFYLPGVTPGIATEDDIPEAAPPISDARYLDAIVNGDEYVTYAAGKLDVWHGPILVRITTEMKPHRRIV